MLGESWPVVGRQMPPGSKSPEPPVSQLFSWVGGYIDECLVLRAQHQAFVDLSAVNRMKTRQ
jgi:hypothetical protein